MREARSLADSGMVKSINGVLLLISSIQGRKRYYTKGSIKSVKLQTPNVLYQKRSTTKAI